jgi:hypothetical protein
MSAIIIDFPKVQLSKCLGGWSVGRATPPMDTANIHNNTLNVQPLSYFQFSALLTFRSHTHTHTHCRTQTHTQHTHTRGVARAHTHGAEKDKNWLPLGPRGGQKCVSGTLWRPKIAVALGKSAHSRERLPPLRKKRDQRLGLKIAGDALRPKLHCSASSSSSSSSRRCPQPVRMRMVGQTHPQRHPLGLFTGRKITSPNLDASPDWSPPHDVVTTPAPEAEPGPPPATRATI